jgi:hypothetical protein
MRWTVSVREAEFGNRGNAPQLHVAPEGRNGAIVQVARSSGRRADAAAWG